MDLEGLSNIGKIAGISVVLTSIMMGAYHISYNFEKIHSNLNKFYNRAKEKYKNNSEEN